MGVMLEWERAICECDTRKELVGAAVQSLALSNAGPKANGSNQMVFISMLKEQSVILSFLAYFSSH